MGRKMIPFYRSDYGNKEFRAVKRVLKSGWTTQGPIVKQLEDEWAKLSGYKYCLAVNSATSGLMLAHIAAETKRVYAPVYTFAATINVLELLGREIKFLDCGEVSFNCDFKRDFNADCLSPVAISGNMTFNGYFDDYKTIILDAAHCWPDCFNTFDLDLIDIAVWSLYANKNIPCGDGGMIGTNNKDWADKIRLLRNHGMSIDTLDRFTSDKPKFFYDVPMPGYKLNMTDLHAAIALEQLKKMPNNRKRRREIRNNYILNTSILSPWGNVDNAEHLFMYVCKDSYERDCLLHYLHDKGISCSVHYKPIHRMSYYRDKYHLTDDMFPNASWFADREITLPLYPALKDSEQRYIIKCIKDFYR